MGPLFYRLSQLRVRTVIASILIATVLIALGLFSVWVWAGKKMERIITDQFNEQQLMLARKIADNVEVYVDFLEYQLVSYAQAYQVEGISLSLFRDFLTLQIDYLKDFGMLGIRVYDTEGQLADTLSPRDFFDPARSESLPAKYLAWTKNPKNKNHLFLTEIFTWPGPPWRGQRVMAILTPLYRLMPNSKNTTHPQFNGVLEIIFDPLFICGMVTRDIRSGKTGYPMIIDQDGFFLAHYEKPFIGRQQNKVRQERNPTLSYERIDNIVNNYMLRGREGTDWYISGWHRERVGEIKKLIAYTPIRFDKGMIRGITQVEGDGRNLWGVGVVAPIEEVYGLVRTFQINQGLFVGFFLFLLMGVSYLLIGAVYGWNRVLAQEVESKTEALRQSHERLLRSERFAAVGEAAAYVSHEIKNPLMVIGGFARQLERNPEVSQTASSKLRIIIDEVRRLENFLGELRDFTRPAPPFKQEADLNELVRDVAAMMGEATQEMGVKIETKLANTLPLVNFDANQMKQVLINLVKNALEATDSGGVITISTAAWEDQVRLSVTDTGKGIQPEIMPQIFNPFFTTKKTGTGLGLAVINKIIEDHNGAITVESSKDRGTTFTISLPCQS